MENSTGSGKNLANRYRLLELIGHGGMASVYRAEDTRLRRTVAVKIIHPHLAEQANLLQRFEAEAVLVAKLHHPNIVRVFDFDHAEGLYFMVMEYLEGETLEKRLKRLAGNQQQMAVEEALRIAIDLCQALEYAHQRGLIHRDIKPANVMLDQEGRPILMDFGIARLLGGGAHTATGTVLGTALYMAPEQVQGQPVDGRADIYALGVTLFQMLSNRPPFEADSVVTLMMKHVQEPPPDVRQFQPRAPYQVTVVLNKALAKQPQERYQTAQEMAEALQAVLAGETRPAEQDLPTPAQLPAFRQGVAPGGVASQGAARQGAAPHGVAPPVTAPPGANLQQQIALEGLLASECPPETRRWPRWALPMALFLILAVAATVFWLLRPSGTTPALQQDTPTPPVQVADTAVETSVATGALLLFPTATETHLPVTQPLLVTFTPTSAPLATLTSLPPTHTPTSEPGRRTGLSGDCIEAQVWSPYKTQNISQDGRGCWDLSHWGVAAQGGKLRIQASNLTTSESYRGLYTPIQRLLAESGSERAILRITLQVEQLVMAPNNTLGLAFGVGKVDSWQYYGRFVALRPSGSAADQLQVYVTNNLQQTGNLGPAVSWTEAHTIEVEYQADTVRLRVNGQAFGEEYTFGRGMVTEPVFWIGFSLPPGGRLSALLEVALGE